MNFFLNILLLIFLDYSLGQNVLVNPDFEFGHSSPWKGYSQLVMETNDVYSGTYALKVMRRQISKYGLYQTVDLRPGGRYLFKAFIKQLPGRHGNLNFNVFQTYNASILYNWAVREPGGPSSEYRNIAIRPLVQFGSGWLSLTGDQIIPTRRTTSTVLHIHGPEADIDFLLDEISLKEIPDNANWKEEANARIEEIRKSTVHLQVVHPPTYSPDDVEVHVDLKRHLFGFGCLVNDSFIADRGFKEYQDIFYKLFNWATLDAFDWKKNKGSKYTNNYTDAVRTMDELLNHGVHIRGNAMFWGMPGKSPAWVEQLDGPGLKEAVKDRLKYITNITRGKIIHWNVNNELLHSQQYEERTGDANYTESLFNMVHTADPSAKLFLNDYSVVADGIATESYADLANQYKAANISLYGLNAESHFNDNRHPDPVLLMKNLDELNVTGLPIWITDLTFRTNNADTRADWLEMALRIFFSHPAVEGVMLGGFWDHESDLYSSLFQGFQFQVNAAGQRYLDLVQNEWSTHLVYNLSMGPIFPLNVFHGDYEITVYYKGKPIKQSYVQMDNTTSVHKIEIDGSETELPLTTTVDPLSYVTHNLHAVNKHTFIDQFRTVKSTANNTDLQCVTRQSDPSPSSSSSTIVCEDGEVLTGCSSLVPSGNNSYHRVSDSMVLNHGYHVVCSASSTYDNHLTGPIAIARCCKLADMKCNYMIAKTDPATADTEPTLKCSDGYTATGCTSSVVSMEHFGTVPLADHSGCVALTGKRHSVYASFTQNAACCRAPQLSCMTVMSAPSGLNKGDNTTASCGPDHVMTSCSVTSYTGLAGATPEGTKDGKEACVATNSEYKVPGEEGVIAVAVCCKLIHDSLPIIG